MPLDPTNVRTETLARISAAGFPIPPEKHLLLWAGSETYELRPLDQLLSRAAALNVVIARAFGTPPEVATGWLHDNGLDASLTTPERAWVGKGEGEARAFLGRIEALWALTWATGIASHLDPNRFCDDSLSPSLPNLPAGEAFHDWKARVAPERRPDDEVVKELDLYFCLDWAVMDAVQRHEPTPGAVPPYVVQQRRWALEWSVLFKGAGRPEAPDWEEIDLSI
jgi:hypothetical protein